MTSERDFRRLTLAYYRRLRKGGLTRAGTRELVGELVNTADAIDLFRIHSDLAALEAIRRIAGSVGADLGSEDDWTRIKARRGLPYIMQAEGTWAAYVHGRAQRQ